MRERMWREGKEEEREGVSSLHDDDEEYEKIRILQRWNHVSLVGSKAKTDHFCCSDCKIVGQ